MIRFILFRRADAIIHRNHDFAELTKENLKKLVGRDDLVYKELKLFYAVVG